MRFLFTEKPLLELHQKKDQDEDKDYTGDLKEMKASLDTEKIKTADRVTFLLNYLFVVLKNNQLNWQPCQEEISLLREIFIAVLQPYI